MSKKDYKIFNKNTDKKPGKTPSKKSDVPGKIESPRKGERSRRNEAYVPHDPPPIPPPKK